MPDDQETACLSLCIMCYAKIARWIRCIGRHTLGGAVELSHTSLGSPGRFRDVRCRQERIAVRVQVSRKTSTRNTVAGSCFAPGTTDKFLCGFKTQCHWRHVPLRERAFRHLKCDAARKLRRGGC